jgi:carboxyl-terminal processing protease
MEDNNEIHKKGDVKKIWLEILLIFLFFGSFIFGFINGSRWGYKASLPSYFDKIIHKEKPATLSLQGANMQVFWDTWQIILEKYIDRDKLNFQSMIEGASSGLVQSLGDPYSEFYNAELTQELNEELSGEFCGVGIEIERRDGVLTIVSPLSGTPASRAGLKPNDQILKIGETDAINMTPTQAAKLIKGEAGTVVTLLIYRDGWDEPQLFTLVREKITIPSMAWKNLDDHLVYIRFYTFSESLASDFEKVVPAILQTEPQKMIIDLRNNPGGYLTAALDIGNWFLNTGDIIVKEDYGHNNIVVHRAKGPGTFKNIPLVILINEGSASASEILAGALRDIRNVKLVGTKSFGKGSVQEWVPLENNNSVKITVARWLTPNGLQIEKNGLKPDVEVLDDLNIGTYQEIDVNKDKQLLKALEVLNNNNNNNEDIAS